jgi:hypothetical protein
LLRATVPATDKARADSVASGRISGRRQPEVARAKTLSPPSIDTAHSVRPESSLLLPGRFECDHGQCAWEAALALFRRPARVKAPMKMVRSKVAGVSFANDDGSSRQTIIRKYCRAGKSLDVRLEPDDRYSEDAMGLWVRGRWLLIFPRRYQVGHIKNEIAIQIREDVIRGCPISVRILDVTGGGWRRKQFYGVNIEIRVGLADEIDSEQRPDRFSAGTSTPNLISTESPSRHPTPRWSALILATSRFLSSTARILVRVARDLATRFSVLSRSQKIIATGFATCCVGLALRVFAYFAERTLGLFSALRPTGVVAIIVGLGIFCLGTVFHFTETTPNRSD